jgi:hypothetical protein
MASRALARVAQSPDDYATVYDRVLGQVREPVIIHWLGDMFDPALAGYWAAAGFEAAMETALDVINRNAARIDGGENLAARQGQGDRHAPPSGAGRAHVYGRRLQLRRTHRRRRAGVLRRAARHFRSDRARRSGRLSALARGDVDSFHDIFGPTVPLSRHIFRAPTRFYKTGVVFMAYLAGHQDHFCMVGGQESARSTLHLAELFRLADRRDCCATRSRPSSRMRAVMRVRGLKFEPAVIRGERSESRNP